MFITKFKNKQKLFFIILFFLAFYHSQKIILYLEYVFEYHIQLFMINIQGKQSYCPSEPILEPMPPSMTSVYDKTNVYDKTIVYENNSWESLIDNQLQNPHSGLVVYKAEKYQGFCNRMLQAISVLMFAMVTNRTFVLEWDHTDTFSPNPYETIGHSDFASLFDSPFYNQSKPSILVSKSVHKQNVDECFAFKLRFGNPTGLNSSVLYLSSGDFWGTLLMLNPKFKHTTFRNLTINSGFPILFKMLFKPKKKVKPKACSWFFQYRYNWPSPYATASFDYYLKCAYENGFSDSDLKTSWIITDNPQNLVSGASYETQRKLLQFNFLEKKKPCRGQCGDNNTIEHMYALSTCQNAVLTHSSSFGVCIAGLANVHTLLKVTRYGECIKPLYNLLDPNSMSKYGAGRTLLHEI